MLNKCKKKNNYAQKIKLKAEDRFGTFKKVPSSVLKNGKIDDATEI